MKDLAHPQHLFQVVSGDLPAEFPAVKAFRTSLHNLPRELTSFVGRKQEIVEIIHLLQTTPLLTLAGPGGAGKTRLAIRVAAETLQRYPDGVWFVDLASLRDPSLVPHAVAIALGIREQPARPLSETLLDVIGGREMLLVLDNCEHVIEAS